MKPPFLAMKMPDPDREGKVTKRCQSVAPTHGDQCTKPHRHRDREDTVIHQSGALIWGDDNRHHHRVTTEMPGGLGHVEFSTGKVDIGYFIPKYPPKVPLTAEEQLRAWWYRVAKEEVDRVVPKAVEYSATDLADIGHVLARTAGRTVSDEEAAELGVFFYLQGKLSRWAGAVAQGKRPSDDTIHDIGVYCRMAQRIRETGGWPGTDEETK